MEHQRKGLNAKTKPSCQHPKVEVGLSRRYLGPTPFSLRAPLGCNQTCSSLMEITNNAVGLGCRASKRKVGPKPGILAGIPFKQAVETSKATLSLETERKPNVVLIMVSGS